MMNEDILICRILPKTFKFSLNNVSFFFKNCYDLLGNTLRTISADSGTSYQLQNVLGQITDSWTPAEFETCD